MWVGVAGARHEAAAAAGAEGPRRALGASCQNRPAQQCSQQAPVPVKDNHLTCCKGVNTRECPHLLALERIERCTPADYCACLGRLQLSHFPFAACSALTLPVAARSTHTCPLPRAHAESYSLFSNNCNNFSDELGQLLCGQGVPNHITGGGGGCLISKRR